MASCPAQFTGGKTAFMTLSRLVDPLLGAVEILLTISTLYTANTIHGPRAGGEREGRVIEAAVMLSESSGDGGDRDWIFISLGASYIVRRAACHPPHRSDAGDTSCLLLQQQLGFGAPTIIAGCRMYYKINLVGAAGPTPRREGGAAWAVPHVPRQRGGGGGGLPTPTASSPWPSAFLSAPCHSLAST